jgi:putative endonuclease
MTYILASRPGGILYVGVTSNIVQRVWRHKNDVFEGFTKRFHVHTLVYYEEHPTMRDAIRREKYIKHQNRAYKLDLINRDNPQWIDLYPGLIGEDDAYDRPPDRPTATAPVTP